ncbi:hypothetical protein [Paenibacillus sp. 481]|uniref:hypothetical protein n=1 Tax=Paenibacillus sp. 481 TaxID=2835869 RepID=UPI001E518A3A|nr:hypothetical protein [Paenibacillus sp. 481]UHA71800.1 hypothetical protein KIK04_13615 [Paenibacillus sp. 481]
MKKFYSFALFFSFLLVLPLQSVSAAQYSEDLIPKMINNNAPAGIASASTQYSPLYAAWKAFNNSIVDGYTDTWESNTNSGWLAYEFPYTVAISKYTLTNFDGTRAPKNWTFEAWDAPTSTWIVLDRRTNESNWRSAEKREFTFTNKAEYNKYRINVTENNGGEFVCIGDMEMMKESFSIKATPGESLVYLSWEALNDVTSYEVKRSAVIHGPYTTIATNVTTTSYIDNDVVNNTKYYYVIEAKLSNGETLKSDEGSATPELPSHIEGMQGVTLPTGSVATASSQYLESIAHKAIDKDMNTRWLGIGSKNTLEIKFPKQVSFEFVQIAGFAEPISNVHYTISGLKDGKWVPISNTATRYVYGRPTITDPINVTAGSYQGIKIAVDATSSWAAINEITLGVIDSVPTES